MYKEHEEAVQEQVIPVVQKLLRAGFKSINREGVLEALSYNEALQIVKSEAMEKVNKELKERTARWRNKGLYNRLTESKPSAEEDGNQSYVSGNLEGYAWFAHNVSLSTVSLDNYVGDTIPDYCYADIQKALDLGAKRGKLKVMFLEANKKLPDPLIVYITGKEEGILISKWV